MSWAPKQRVVKTACSSQSAPSLLERAGELISALFSDGPSGGGCLRGHPLVTAQRKDQRYVTRDIGIGERFKYTYWGCEDLEERMAENETVTTPFMSEEDYRVLLRKTKGCINAHKGHIILIQTKMLEYIRKAELHDMETIAEIQRNTLETLKAKEAKKGS